MTINLTDAQLVMMNTGAQRNDRCLAPERLKGAAAQKVRDKLAKLGLAREIKAKPGMPIWHHDEARQPMALKLTPIGLKLIGVPEQPEGSPKAYETPFVERPPLADQPTNETEFVRRGQESAPRDGTKLAVVIGLLCRTDGATLVNLTEATGWLRHTTRAAITALRKRGYSVTRNKDDAGTSIYRVVATPTRESSSPPDLAEALAETQNDAETERAA